jgi:hypothetical protein
MIETSADFGAHLGRLDRMAIGLSALCGIHCLATTLLIGALASFSSVLESPLIHETGLALAIVMGALALGLGAMRHGILLPVAIGSLGLGVMSGALSLPHGPQETVYTLLGVAMLSIGHLLNRQAAGHNHSH